MNFRILLFIILCIFLLKPECFSQPPGLLTRNSAADTTYWWNDAVFYEAFVRSFYDNNGDGVGDLKGLISKLDYLNDGDPNTNTDLGINAIWLMPVCASPSYHGYDITDYRKIQPAYGTNQDFIDLINAAHARGIKIIVDFVMNHTSNYHPWFEKSNSNDPFYRNFYRWSETKPTYTGPWGQEVWHYFSPSNYYYGIFWSGMPDLNYTYQPVKDSIFSIADYWLNTMHADGFRCDAAPYIIEDGDTLQDTPETLTFWKDFTDHFKAVNPNAMSVGEVWDNTPNVIEKYSHGQFDYCFEFNIESTILIGVLTGNPQTIITSVQNAYNQYPFLQFAPFLSNHDQNRVFDDLGNNTAKMKTAAAIYLTLPGIPYVYYGEEVGMNGSGDDQYKRKPMQWSTDKNSGFTTGTPWEALNPNYTTYNVTTEQSDSNSIWRWYQKLITIRNEQSALRRGTYASLISNKNSVYAFIRTYKDEQVLVAINLGSSDLTGVTINALGSNLQTGTNIVTDLLNHNTEVPVTVDAGGTISGLTLKAQGALIYKLSGSTSIDNISNIQSVTIYPNPADGIAQIEFGKEISTPLSVSIFDLQGKLLSIPKVESMDNRNFKIDIHNLPEGIFFIQLKSNSQITTLKMIKL